MARAWLALALAALAALGAASDPTAPGSYDRQTTLRSGYTMHWRCSEAAIDVLLVSDTAGFLGWGVAADSQGLMAGADIVVARVNDQSQVCSH